MKYKKQKKIHVVACDLLNQGQNEKLQQGGRKKRKAVRSKVIEEEGDSYYRKIYKRKSNRRLS
jgi:hypothetical protein